MRILIVDDEHFIRRLVFNVLEVKGHEVYTMEDPVKALRLAQKKDFDLILLDVMMPNMDGMTLCQKLRSKKATKNVPIMMLTSKTQLSDVQEAVRAGANDYIMKPFNADTLEALIRKKLKRVLDDFEE